MTERDFLTAVANTITDETLANEAKERIGKIDAKNAKRASKPSKTAIANEPLKAQIVDYLAQNEQVTAADIAGLLEVSTAKASSLLRSLKTDGKVIATQVKVTRVKNGKKNTATVNAYKKA